MGIEQGGISGLDSENTTQRYEVLIELGDCHASMGNYAKARCCYDKAALLGPDEAAPYIGLGVVALQQGLLDDAQIAFRVAARLDNTDSRVHAGLAMVAQEKQDYEQAFTLYLKCLEADSDNLTALLGLFQVSCRMGTFGKVIHYLEVYLDMHPGDSSVKFSLAALLVREGKFERAGQLLRDVICLNPANVDAANLLEEVEYALAAQAGATG